MGYRDAFVLAERDAFAPNASVSPEVLDMSIDVIKKALEGGKIIVHSGVLQQEAMQLLMASVARVLLSGIAPQSVTTSHALPPATQRNVISKRLATRYKQHTGESRRV
jgi:hypothetical protein